MTTVKRLLVPVDFSDSSRKAIGYGVAIAEKTGAKLYLAHILAAVPSFGYVFPENPLDMDAKRLADARQTLLGLLPPNHDELHYELVTRIGAVEDELLGIAREEDIDLVIMGSRGRTGLRRWFLGSVTEHLLRKLPVPVLTVSHIAPGHALDAGKEPLVAQILFATDLGDGVEKGLQASVQLARYFKANLTVAHVVARPPFEEIAPAVSGEFMFGADATAVAEQLHAVTDPYLNGLKVDTAILRGEPYEAILHFADANDIDLVVLNLERKSALERVLLGATAEQVVRLAHMPVLSIPVDVAVAAIDTSVAVISP